MADNANISTARKFGRFPSVWTIAAALVAGLVILPILVVIYLAFFPTENIWPHLLSTTLPRYLGNSLIMMGAVGALSALIGVSTAWFIVTKDFPMRRTLEWSLFFPLAVPAYIGAYAFVDFWEYAGPVQTQLRDWFGWQTSRDYYFPQVRARGAAVLVIALSLYPYVYLLARTAFRDQSSRTLEVARALGVGPRGVFFRVALPLARPAIAIGVSLVMMETLNDFGAVEFFAVQTLTTGVFTVWLEASNVGGAAQISGVILALLTGLLFLERRSRNKMKVHQRHTQMIPPSREKLRGGAALLVMGVCALPVILGFIMPSLIMLSHALHVPEIWQGREFRGAISTSLWVSLSAALLTVGAAVILVYAVRMSRSNLARKLAPISTIGYAAPGAVLAVGILIPMAALDHRIADIFQTLWNVEIGLLITGSAGAVIFAYFVRFFALAYGSVDSAMGRYSPNIGWAARSLGKTPAAVLRRVHLPLIHRSLLIAVLLVFVDSIKELPATLLLRPFGFETLATQIYNAASLEDINGASAASIVVILVGMLAVAVLARASR
ncbi:iron ABC transporter permease [Amylibacter marinus]|uniref:Iron ABC transporter permease n=1 Tax=Amylibacter marinus TaxID=1475483 RepID=A0ABQ5VUL1_9RHOB|nr:iron ABC transporter permease [Amylibacter marinus]GLQ34942.1 iron ABC transporter permease [Amylibacter marinus]